LQRQRLVSRLQAAAIIMSTARRSAKTAPRHPGDFATSENNYHNRMFENLAAAAWVGTLFTAAYYVFSTLLASS
jgi:hypothetical protein